MDHKSTPPAVKEGWKSCYEGARFGVHSTTVTSPDGGIHTREAVIHPGAVLIIPVMDDGRIIMIRNERFAVGETLWELPAGTLEPQETPLKTAQREIIEETGYKAEKMKELFSFYTSPGICNEIIYSYVARDLEYVGQDLDETENITVHPMPFEQTLQMIQDGDIIDGKTILTLLYYKSFIVKPVIVT